jgi:hypothetical protein
MYSLLFFLLNILVKGLQMWKLSQVLHAFHDSYFSCVEQDFSHSIRKYKKLWFFNCLFCNPTVWSDMSHPHRTSSEKTKHHAT